MVDFHLTDPNEPAPGPCPGCGADRPCPSRYGNGSFSVVRCTNCDLWYLSPRLSEHAMVERYRQGGYFDGDIDDGYADYAGQEKSLRATFRALLQRLDDRGMTGGTLLEVGCGYGYFLDEAAPFFNFRAGLEMSAAAADVARNHADTIHNDDLSTLPDRQFDCIVALHVIEHVYDPQGFLRQLVERLTPGGVLVLAAPDMAGFWRPLLGNRWPSFKYPEHVAFYTERTLSRLMRNAGCRQPTRLPYPHAFPIGEICAKVGLKAPRSLESRNMWLPATTVAVVGTR